MFVANRRRIEVANISRQCYVNFCSTGSKHFCSIEEVAPWMNPLNERSRPLFRPRTRRKEDSPSPDNNRSSSSSLVIRSTFDGHEDSQPFFDLDRLHGEAFFLWSINKISPAWDINPETDAIRSISINIWYLSYSFSSAIMNSKISTIWNHICYLANLKNIITILFY